MPPSKAKGKRVASGTPSGGSTTLFRQRQSRYLKGVAKLTSVAEARVGLHRLWQEFNSTADKTLQLKIARITLMAANRAQILAQRSDVAVAKRRMFADVSRTYKAEANQMFIRYKQLHPGGAQLKKAAAAKKRWTY